MVYPEKFCITNVSLENYMNDKKFFFYKRKKNKNVIKIKIIFIKFVL